MTEIKSIGKTAHYFLLYPHWHTFYSWFFSICLPTRRRWICLQAVQLGTLVSSLESFQLLASFSGSKEFFFPKCFLNPMLFFLDISFCHASNHLKTLKYFSILPLKKRFVSILSLHILKSLETQKSYKTLECALTLNIT